MPNIGIYIGKCSRIWAEQLRLANDLFCQEVYYQLVLGYSFVLQLVADYIGRWLC